MKPIGDEIRARRRQREMTQEQLAALLGVSPQSVSKWENGLTAPDISLLPVLAGVFKISIDELFGYNVNQAEEQVMAICRESWAWREGDPVRARQVLQEGLRRFPGDPILLNNYLCTLDMQTESDEIIAVATRLAEQVEGKGKLDDVYYDALRFQAEAYAHCGEQELARATLERIPEIYFTKLSVAAQILTGELKGEAAVKQKWISVEMLVDMLRELALYHDGQGQPEKARAERERGRKLVDLFAEGQEQWAACLRRELEEPEEPKA